MVHPSSDMAISWIVLVFLFSSSLCWTEKSNFLVISTHWSYLNYLEQFEIKHTLRELGTKIRLFKDWAIQENPVPRVSTPPSPKFELDENLSFWKVSGNSVSSLVLLSSLCALRRTLSWRPSPTFDAWPFLSLVVFDHSYRDYVLSWYGHLSRDEGRLYQLLSEGFWEVARQLRHRLGHVDLVRVVCNDVVRALLSHFCDLKAASAR